MAPHLHDGQIVLLFQGNFAGAHVFRRTLDSAGVTAKVEVAEMDAFPYSLAINAADRVEMRKVKAKWQMVASPVDRTAHVLKEIGWAFPGMMAAPSLLNTGFTEMGGMFHAGAMVTNVGRVEDAASYNFYAANMVPSVCRLLEKMDAERVGVAAAYSVTIPDVRTWLRETYFVDKPTLHEALQEMAFTRYLTAPAPKSLSHRYLVQDVTCILVPITELGRVAGVPTPASDTVIDMANLLMDRDFRAEGRNLNSLGWQSMTVAEIARAAAR
jgi:opine dehydrogenase